MTTQIPDKTLTPSQGNTAMLLRTSTMFSRKGSKVQVRLTEEGARGKLVERVREIDRIVVHGSGDITIYLKDD